MRPPPPGGAESVGEILLVKQLHPLEMMPERFRKRVRRIVARSLAPLPSRTTSGC